MEVLQRPPAGNRGSQTIAVRTVQDHTHTHTSKDDTAYLIHRHGHSFRKVPLNVLQKHISGSTSYFLDLRHMKETLPALT